MSSQSKKPKGRASIAEKSPYDDPLNDTLFGKTDKLDEVSSKPKDREPVTKSKTRTTSLKMYEHQLDWLDQKCTEARKEGGKGIRKAAIIRALIDLAMDSNADLAGVKSEEEVVERFKQATHKNG